MRRKIFNFALVMGIMLNMFVTIQVTVSAETDGIYKYTVENGEATFTGFNESVSGEVVIPSTLGGYPVTTIGTKAFFTFNQPISVTLPASVTTFKDIKLNPSSLVGINVDEGNPNYSSVDGVLFNKDKTVLLRYPEMKDKGTYIVPDTVTEIGDWAFSFCPGLTGITLPEGLISIGESAFEVCGYLPSVTIPESVTSIGGCAFRTCVSLTEINVDEGNSIYSSENGVLFNKDKTALIQYPAAKYDEEYNIPESVTTIGDWSLGYCQSSTINIPNSVISIGDSAFRFCNITSITIPDSVTSIGKEAFYGCETLTDIIMSGNVTSIGEYAFYTCDSLTNIMIPDGVIRLEKGAFGYCKNLTSITIPASVTGDVRAAVRDCEKLTDIDVDENNPNYSSIDGVLYNKDRTTLIQYPMGKSNPIYYIPDGVTNIGKNAFERCKNLISVTIPDGVTIIDENAFSDCENLTNIRIPASVITIAEDAFSGCESLTHVFYGGARSEWNSIDIGGYNYALEDADVYYGCKLPWDCQIEYTIENGEVTITSCSSDLCGAFIIPETIEGYPVTEIGSYAFDNCYKLVNIIIPSGVTSIGNRAFDYCNSMTNITIPASVTSLGNEVFYDCGDLTSIDVDKNNPNYCSDDGVLFNKDKTTLIQYPEGKGDENYSIPDGVTKIGDCAFRNCSTLTNISIPDDLITIGGYAFRGCNNLTDIIIPASVTSVGAFAFSSCRGITNITIPEGITSIEKHAFSWCESVTEVTIPKNVTAIGDSAFYGCTSLTDITIPESVIVMGDRAFYGCNNLKNVNYGGTKRMWNAISIGNSNTTLTNANITFVEQKTETVLSNGDKTFTITPINIKPGNTIILALYKGDQFVETQYATYEGKELVFTTNATYTEAKAMVWNDLTEFTPVCDAEIVK